MGYLKCFFSTDYPQNVRFALIALLIVCAWINFLFKNYGRRNSINTLKSILISEKTMYGGLEKYLKCKQGSHSLRNFCFAYNFEIKYKPIINIHFL